VITGKSARMQRAHEQGPSGTHEAAKIHVFCDSDAGVSEDLRDHVEIRALASINDALNGVAHAGASGRDQPARRPGRTSATHCPDPAACQGARKDQVVSRQAGPLLSAPQRDELGGAAAWP